MGRRENKGARAKRQPCGDTLTPLCSQAPLSALKTKRTRQQFTIEFLRDQASLPSGWPLEREASSFAHRLHRLLNGEQLGRLVCFEVPWANCCQR